MASLWGRDSEVNNKCNLSHVLKSLSTKTHFPFQVISVTKLAAYGSFSLKKLHYSFYQMKRKRKISYKDLLEDSFKVFSVDLSVVFLQLKQ